MRTLHRSLFIGLAIALFALRNGACAADKPNVILILADDLGYGDVRCYQPERGKIAPPHLDRLAAQKKTEPSDD